jgi:hypothetical protein
MAYAARAYLRAYSSELFFDFRRNGEGWLFGQVCRLKSDGPLVCIDVGANHGEWTAICRGLTGWLLWQPPSHCGRLAGPTAGD